MTTEINGYGKFLRDAVTYLVSTRDENMGDEYGRSASPDQVPAFHYWVSGNDDNYAQYLTVEGDATVVTVCYGAYGECAVRSLVIEPTDEGFVVMVPHYKGQGRPAGKDISAPYGKAPYTEQWQFFVADAINLYVGHGICPDEWEVEDLYGNELGSKLRPILEGINGWMIDPYDWDRKSDLLAIGDVQDDQDYASVEYRLVHIEA